MLQSLISLTALIDLTALTGLTALVDLTALDLLQHTVASPQALNAWRPCVSCLLFDVPFATCIQRQRAQAPHHCAAMLVAAGMDAQQELKAELVADVEAAK